MVSRFHPWFDAEVAFPAAGDPLSSPGRPGTPLEGHANDEANACMRDGELILLVDDNPMVLDSTKLILESHGYTVLHAGSPEEAIRIADLHAGAIRMLMTDIIMPGMNGLALADRLLSRYPNMKCLYMSGYSNGILADLGGREADTPYIQKPFSMDSLVAKVREVLDTKA